MATREEADDVDEAGVPRLATIPENLDTVIKLYYKIFSKNFEMIAQNAYASNFR